VKIGGLQKLTLIDYPGKLACTVFLSGCNFRCSWCYSPELVLPEKIEGQPEVKRDVFFDFLEKRKGKIEGVVICGGEPLINEDLLQFAKKIKEKGFSVKVDTNGSRPEMLKALLKGKLLDYIAMDLKVPLNRYQEISRKKGEAEKIKESIEVVMGSGVDYEFRTTLVPEIHKKKDVSLMAEAIKGAEIYFLQNFFPEKTLEESFLARKPFTKKELEDFKKVAEPFVKKCKIR